MLIEANPSERKYNKKYVYDYKIVDACGERSHSIALIAKAKFADERDERHSVV